MRFGSRPRRLARQYAYDGDAIHGALLSGDGTLVAYYRRNTDGADIFVLRLDGGGERRLTKDGESARTVA